MTESDAVAAAVTALITALQAVQPAPASTAPQTMLTVRETAEILRCSEAHIYTQLKDGGIRGVKIGRRRLVPMSEIRRITEGRDP